MSIQDAVAVALRSDPVLGAMLATARGSNFPAVFAGWAIDGQPEPYVTFRLSDEADARTWFLGRGALDVDVWDRGPGWDNAREVAGAIIRCLENTTLSHTGTLVRLYYAGAEGVPEDTPAGVHYSVRFNTRVSRGDYVD